MKSYKFSLRILSLSLGFLLVACSPAARFAQHTKTHSNLSFYSQDGELQNTIIKDTPKGVRFCSGNPPDAVKTDSVGLEVASAAETTGVEESDGAISLGGRNPALLITRELLFRACELSMNLDADPIQTLAIYRDFMEAAQTITKTQSGSGNAALASSPKTFIQVDAPNDEDDDDDDDDDDDVD